MIPLFYCALADTDVVEVPYGMVFVHEWGVVELDMGHLEATGTRWGYLDECGYLVDYNPVEVEAPVVWFHGAECSGTFSVEVTGGDFTELLPYPDSLAFHAIPGIEASETHVAVWEDLRLSYQLLAEPVEAEVLEVEEIELEEEQIPLEGPFSWDFQWAMPIWRRVPSNVLYYPGADYMDSFLYYECSIIPYGMFSGDYYGYTGPALLFYDNDGLTCARVTVPSIDTREVIESIAEILEEFCAWASGGLKSSEIEALWCTWEPALRRRCELNGETVLVFPLSGRQIETISRIRFEPDGDNQVRYDRLFLGLGAI